MRPSFLSPPRPHLKITNPKLPRWKKPDRDPPLENFHRLTAPDFGVSLKPNIKAVSWRQYDEELKHRLITNDGTEQSLMWLTMARNIFHQELSQMPENYISKLIFNPNHSTVILIQNGIVLGGIAFRSFPDLNFAEIAFCAVSSNQQIRGLGGYLMAQVKTVLQALGIFNILTYADNSAVGYFKRQGFTREILLDPAIWHQRIKDYQGATLIHCRIHPYVDYLHFNEICDQQIMYTSSLLADAELMTVNKWPVKQIRGITIQKGPTLHISDQLRLLLGKIKQHSKAWPFLKAVSKNEAPNYYDIIKQPMDLLLLEQNVNNGKYADLAHFEKDLRLIFTNCRNYNRPESVYYKSATELETYVNQLLDEHRTLHIRK